MKVNVGETIKIDVLKSKIPKTQIASHLKLSRVWLDKLLQDEEMEEDYVLGIGELLHIDYSKKFPELNKRRLNSIIEDPNSPYSEMTVIELKDKLIEVQDKYTKLLEAFIELQNKQISN